MDKKYSDGRLVRELARHGMDWTDLGRLLRAQNFECGACHTRFGPKKRIQFDRDQHGCVRGLLCLDCLNGQYLPFDYCENPPAAVFTEPRRLVRT